MSTVDYKTSQEYSSDSEQSLASKVFEASFHSANEEFFLLYDVRADVRFQLIILSSNCLKFFFSSPYYLSYLAEVQNISKICLYNDCSSGPSLSKSLFQRISRCSADKTYRFALSRLFEAWTALSSCLDSLDSAIQRYPAVQPLFSRLSYPFQGRLCNFYPLNKPVAK